MIYKSFIDLNNYLKEAAKGTPSFLFIESQEPLCLPFMEMLSEELKKHENVKFLTERKVFTFNLRFCEPSTYFNELHQEEVMPVIVAMAKETLDREYIFILNNTSNNSLVSLDSLGEMTLSNTRTYIETQCSPDIDKDILRTMDRVLFKTLNANAKLLHSNSPIEKERAILDCGEALYISEGNEICKVCFANAHNIGE